MCFLRVRKLRLHLRTWPLPGWPANVFRWTPCYFTSVSRRLACGGRTEPMPSGVHLGADGGAVVGRVYGGPPGAPRAYRGRRSSCPHRRLAGLAGAEADVPRLRLRPAEGVNFRAQPTARAAHGVVALFLGAPAGCRRARTPVASRKTLWRSSRFRRVRTSRIFHHPPPLHPALPAHGNGVPLPVRLGSRAPLRARAQDGPNPFHHLTMPTLWRRPARCPPGGNKRLIGRHFYSIT